jgi:hypothetical protein
MDVNSNLMPTSPNGKNSGPNPLSSSSQALLNSSYQSAAIFYASGLSFLNPTAAGPNAISLPFSPHHHFNHTSPHSLIHHLTAT